MRNKTVVRTALSLGLVAQLVPIGPLSAQTLTTLHAFTSHADGGGPSATLVQSSNTLFGVTGEGGNSYDGTVFAINTDGSSFRVLSDLAAAGGGKIWAGAGLMDAGGVLYGTTVGAGSAIPSAVFSINSDGTAFQILYNFVGTSWGPRCALVLSNDTLYGTTFDGGSSGAGSVFALSTDGTSITTLYEFTALSGSGTNSDGAQPVSGLTLSGNTLYGTARGGGTFGYGTLFALNIDSTEIGRAHV